MPQPYTMVHTRRQQKIGTREAHVQYVGGMTSVRSNRVDSKRTLFGRKDIEKQNGPILYSYGQKGAFERPRKCYGLLGGWSKVLNDVRCA